MDAFLKMHKNIFKSPQELKTQGLFPTHPYSQGQQTEG